jgi:hypothetical protein
MVKPVFAIIDTWAALLILLLYCVLIIPAWLIARKAGYPGWVALFLLIPGASFFMYIAFALVEWPIELELKQLHQTAPKVN